MAAILFCLRARNFLLRRLSLENINIFILYADANSLCIEYKTYGALCGALLFHVYWSLHYLRRLGVPSLYNSSKCESLVERVSVLLMRFTLASDFSLPSHFFSKIQLTINGLNTFYCIAENCSKVNRTQSNHFGSSFV